MCRRRLPHAVTDDIFSPREERKIRSVSNTRCLFLSITPGLAFCSLHFNYSLSLSLPLLLCPHVFMSVGSCPYDHHFSLSVVFSGSLLSVSSLTLLSCLTHFCWHKYDMSSAAKSVKHPLPSSDFPLRFIDCFLIPSQSVEKLEKEGHFAC